MEFIVVTEEISLPYNLSFPGKPSSKPKIFPFCIMAFCYVINCGSFRLCFLKKHLHIFHFFAREEKKFYAGQIVLMSFDSCFWQSL